MRTRTLSGARMAIAASAPAGWSVVGVVPAAGAGGGAGCVGVGGAADAARVSGGIMSGAVLGSDQSPAAARVSRSHSA